MKTSKLFLRLSTCSYRILGGLLVLLLFIACTAVPNSAVKLKPTDSRIALQESNNSFFIQAITGQTTTTSLNCFESNPVAPAKTIPTSLVSLQKQFDGRAYYDYGQHWQTVTASADSMKYSKGKLEVKGIELIVSHKAEGTARTGQIYRTTSYKFGTVTISEPSFQLYSIPGEELPKYEYNYSHEIQVVSHSYHLKDLYSYDYDNYDVYTGNWTSQKYMFSVPC